MDRVLHAVNRFPRLAKRRPHTRGGASQVLVVVAALGAVMALGALATDRFVIATPHPFEAANDDAIYTGSILYMPDAGHACHQWLFDNRDGQFTDKGTINCEDAENQELDGPKQWSADRIKVISSGFREH